VAEVAGAADDDHADEEATPLAINAEIDDDEAECWA
jgi:hypothetical protein